MSIIFLIEFNRVIEGVLPDRASDCIVALFELKFHDMYSVCSTHRCSRLALKHLIGPKIPLGKLGNLLQWYNCVRLLTHYK